MGLHLRASTAVGATWVVLLAPGCGGRIEASLGDSRAPGDARTRRASQQPDDDPSGPGDSATGGGDAVSSSGDSGSSAGDPPDRGDTRPPGETEPPGGGDDTTPSEPCGCYWGEGWYCASLVAEHAAENGCEVEVLAGHEDDLLHCAGGAWSIGEECAEGCAVQPPGTADRCALPPCPCYYGDGLYCASSVADYGAENGCDVDVLAGHSDDLLRCTGANWTVEETCAEGCAPQPPGTADRCATDGGYLLPWSCGTAYRCTQGNHGDICASNNGNHTGSSAYAWDFGVWRGQPIVAARSGTVTVAAQRVGPGDYCYDGCPQAYGTTEFWNCCNACIHEANYVNVAHGDGTVATYVHLQSVLVAAGQWVDRGDTLGTSGTTGCSSGAHLHFQVMGDCPYGYCNSIPISFDEAGVPACGQTHTSGNCQ